MMEQDKPSKGLLIVFEGISGSGKSEGINGLVRDMRSSGEQVILYEWNARPAIRKWTRRLAQTRLLGPQAYSLLQWLGFVLDYWRIIRPALQRGFVVIADRYYFTGLTRDEVNGASKRLGNWISKRVRQPDLLYYVDTPVSVCYERILARGKKLFHPNKKLRRRADVQNHDMYYLELMDKAYRRILQIHDSDHARPSSYRKGYPYGMVSTIGGPAHENVLSGRDVWGCSESAESLAD